MAFDITPGLQTLNTAANRQSNFQLGAMQLKQNQAQFQQDMMLKYKKEGQAALDRLIDQAAKDVENIRIRSGQNSGNTDAQIEQMQQEGIASIQSRLIRDINDIKNLYAKAGVNLDSQMYERTAESMTYTPTIAAEQNIEAQGKAMNAAAEAQAKFQSLPGEGAKEFEVRDSTTGRIIANVARLKDGGYYNIATAEPFNFDPNQHTLHNLSTVTAGKAEDLLSPRTNARVEADLIELEDELSRLKGIQKAFDEEFLTIPSAIRKGLGDLWMKFGGDLSKEERVWRDKYVTLRQKAIENINLYIKRITGAQMSEAEANRLRDAMPDPKKDAPDVFKTKLDNAFEMAELIYLRRKILMHDGVISRKEILDDMALPEDQRVLGDKISAYLTLDDVDNYLIKKTMQQEDILRRNSPELSDQEIRKRAALLIQQEYGL